MRLPSALANRDSIAVFLFDSSHLAGFEVFYYSLRKTKSLQGIKKVLLTTDQSLLEDCFLQRVFHSIVLLSPEKLASFREINHSAVSARHRHQLVAKYTFLKFNVFSEVPAKQILYFDVDMVCLQNIDSLLTPTSADLAVARPLAKGNLLDSHGKRKPEPQCEQVVERFCRDSNRFAAMTPKPHRRLTLNSGVLVVGDKLIGPEIRDHLLAKAKNGAYGYEQHVLRDYIQERKDITVQYLDAGYNFPRRALDTTSVEYFSRIRHRIRILHFNGGHPWKRGRQQNQVDFIWWNLYAESRPFIEALRGKRAKRSWLRHRH